MSSLKYYLGDHNGMLNTLKGRLGNKVVDPRDADVWIVFQDCRGSYKDLIETARFAGLNKRIYTIQHGRGASYDYGPPNNMTMISDRFLAWGKSDYDRMVKLGYGDKTTIVGCPLNSQIRPRIPHKEKVILFVPVNTGKEEPENIAAYYELLSLKYKNAKIVTLDHKVALKDSWGFKGKKNVSFNELGGNMDVVAKLLPWHDKALYHGRSLVGFQDHPMNNQIVFSLLQNVDMVVGLDEGTTEAFAYGFDVPVVTIDGFKYRQHDESGKTYETDGIYHTPASTHVNMDDLAEAVEYGLAHPEFKREERRAQAELELGLSYGDPTANILKVIKQDANSLSIR